MAGLFLGMATLQEVIFTRDEIVCLPEVFAAVSFTDSGLATVFPSTCLVSALTAVEVFKTRFLSPLVVGGCCYFWSAFSVELS